VEEVFTIGMNRAVEVLAQKRARGPRAGAAAGPLKVLGEHPDGGEVQVMPGRYGPYVKWGKVNATLPKGVEPEELALDEALILIAEKAGKGGKKPTAEKAGSAKPAATAAPKAAKKVAKPKAKAAAKPAARKAAPQAKD
jgi:DNA topoisomerase-1